MSCVCQGRHVVELWNSGSCYSLYEWDLLELCSTQPWGGLMWQSLVLYSKEGRKGVVSPSLNWHLPVYLITKLVICNFKKGLIF